MKAIAAAALVALLCVGAAAVLSGLPPVGDGVLRWLLAAPAAAVIYSVITLAHQLGHALGGAVVGFRLAAVHAGLVRMRRVEGAIRVEPALSPGRARFDEPRDQDLRRRWLVVVLCGPVLSLMLGAQCLAVWLATSSMLLAGDASPWVRASSAALVLVGAGSLLFGVLTLLPVRAAGVRTDGWTALRLMKEDADVTHDVAHHIRP